MCKCRPEVRTPYCGRLGCEWPGSKPEGAREADGLESLRAELTRVRAERDEFQAFRDRVTDVRVRLLESKGGQTNIRFDVHPDMMSLMAESLLQQFKGDGGINYVEYTVEHPVEGPFTLTMQKKRCPTPAELRNAAERDRDALKARCDGISGPLKEMNRCICEPASICPRCQVRLATAITRAELGLTPTREPDREEGTS